MSSGFKRFIDRLRGDAALRGQASLPEARFQPPPAPPPTWHSVRDDLEQTLDSLAELRGVLNRYQQALDEMQRRADAAGDGAAQRSPGNAGIPGAPGMPGASGLTRSDPGHAPGTPKPD